MLQNAYLLAKIGADTAENERDLPNFCQKLATTRPGRDPAGRSRRSRTRTIVVTGHWMACGWGIAEDMEAEGAYLCFFDLRVRTDFYFLKISKRFVAKSEEILEI